MSKRIKRPVYAIIRYDRFQDEHVALNNRITVKAIVFDLVEAEKEVKRLNELNGEKGAFYWWQYTQLILPDETANETIS